VGPPECGLPLRDLRSRMYALDGVVSSPSTTPLPPLLFAYNFNNNNN